jgi:hypothetical protein
MSFNVVWFLICVMRLDIACNQDIRVESSEMSCLHTFYHFYLQINLQA